jgi:CarboxypepD_reg-like domain
MLKVFNLLLFLPFCCFAQVTISGRALNQADTKPVANASVFLSKTAVGGKTNNEGKFLLQNAKPGKYNLVISIVGFETYTQTVTVGNSNVILPDILILPKSMLLNEVKIKPRSDPGRDKYYNLFAEQFLGTSELSTDCKILNPEILDLDYDDATSTLTASSPDFIEIENDALGYKIKYKLDSFKMENKDLNSQKVHYDGSCLFEALKGTPGQQRRWQKYRQQVYEGSAMHFLRSALDSNLDQQGFRVLQLAIYANPERPADNLIDAKIKFYKKLKSEGAGKEDSLSYWNKKYRLPKTLQKLMPFPLNKKDFIKPTNQQGLFALGCDYDGL